MGGVGAANWVDDFAEIDMGLQMDKVLTGICNEIKTNLKQHRNQIEVKSTSIATKQLLQWLDLFLFEARLEEGIQLSIKLWHGNAAGWKVSNPPSKPKVLHRCWF